MNPVEISMVSSMWLGQYVFFKGCLSTLTDTRDLRFTISKAVQIGVILYK